jgi:hypothetical protein
MALKDAFIARRPCWRLAEDRDRGAAWHHCEGARGTYRCVASGSEQSAQRSQWPVCWHGVALREGVRREGDTLRRMQRAYDLAQLREYEDEIKIERVAEAA